MEKELEILTLARAKELKGKTIEWTYFGYNPNRVEKLVVGDIISEWEYYKTQPCNGFKSLTDYWESYMAEAQKTHAKNRLILLDAEGKNTYIYCETKDGWFKELTFYCSDADRAVFFVVCE